MQRLIFIKPATLCFAKRKFKSGRPRIIKRNTENLVILIEIYRVDGEVFLQGGNMMTKFIRME